VLGCQAPPFSDAEVAAVCEPQLFGRYVQQRVELAEMKMEVEKAREFAQKVARLEAMDERTRRVETCAMRVRDALNNACPRCKAVFEDFNGCTALTCHRCSAGFCAWCLADCGADAHRHVASCARNLAPGHDVFSPMEVWVEGCAARRRREVTDLLRGLADRSIAHDVALKVMPELVDLNIADVAAGFINHRA